MAVSDVGAPAPSIKSAVAGPWDFVAFTTNAGSGYLVGVAANTDQSGTAPTVTVSWTAGGSGTWSQLFRFNQSVFTPALEFWYCKAAASVAGSTIQVAGAAVPNVLAYVRELTGEDSAAPLGATATDTTAADTAVTLTPTSTGGRVYTACVDRFEGFTPVADANSVLIDAYNPGGQELWACRSVDNTTAGTPASVGVTSVGGGNNSSAGVEIVPAAGGGAQFPVSGSVAAVSGAALSAAGRYPVAAQPAAAVSAVALDATALRPVSGSVSAVSDASLDVGVVSGGGFAVAGTVAAVSAAAGTVSLRAAVAGTVPAVSATRLDAPALHPVAGTAAAVSASSLDATADYHVAGAVHALTGAALTAAALLAADPLPINAVTTVSLSAGLFGFIPDLWPDDLGTYRETSKLGIYTGPDDLGTYKETA